MSEQQKPEASTITRPRLGFGCPGGGDDGQLAEVYAFLAQGSPRLALARARGVPFAPYIVNVRATFPDTSTTLVPDVGSDVKISQDIHIFEMNVRIFNESSTANQNQFQAQADWYYNFQSGIEATLDVVGAPRYSVAQAFTPLANLMDAFNGTAKKTGRGWILSYQQQLFMSFQAKVTIPTAPIEVVCTFNGEAPVSQTFTRMDNAQALACLQSEFGLDLPDSYTKTALLYG